MTTDPLLAAIGARIRAERQAAGLTQAELAAQVGVLRTSLVNIEAGRQNTTLARLAHIARVLDCALGDLLPPAEWPSDARYDGRRG